MRTREDSLQNFYSLLDELMSSKYLLAQSCVFKVVTAINNSKILSTMLNHFIDGFDFEKHFTQSLHYDGEVKSFTLPEKNTDVVALVYLILREINLKKLQLVDLLDFFDGGKNYELAYTNFCKEVLVPFKSYVYQIAVQLINGTQTEVIPFEEHIATPINTEKTEENTENSIPNKNVIDSDDVYILRLRRLLDLDRLAITQSKLSFDDKEELIYVLNIFDDTIKEGKVDKIKLAYLAYYYANRPFKKIKTNLKTITEILIEQKII